MVASSVALPFCSVLPLCTVLPFLCGLASAQSITVLSGLTNDQVLQRSVSGEASVRVNGSGQGLDGKPFEMRVLKGGSAASAGWKRSGTINGGAWSATIGPLPTGGPYRIEFRAEGTPAAVVDRVWVGDLWVLAGQSNMEGVGNLENVQASDAKVHSFDMSDRWGVAQEPLHSLPDSADRVHWRMSAEKVPERYVGEQAERFRRERKKGAGLGLPFAVELVRRTGVPIGLVPCAHGGTSMDQWSPSLRDKGGDSLYGALYRRVNAVGGTVKGVLWYQGESDASPARVGEFPAKFARLVAALREDLRLPDLPFYYVQLGRHVNAQNEQEWNAVQEAQRVAEARTSRTGFVTAVDTSLDDGIHVGTPDLKRLGVNLAKLACKDMGVAACAGLQRGPRPVSAHVEGGTIRVRYGDVNGKLQSEGRLAGFSIHDAAGMKVPLLYRMEVDIKDPSSVLLYVGGKLPEGATLRYGAGKDPYCNLRDTEGFGAPAFGPMPLQP